MSWQVVEGDCVEQMRAMGESSVDAIVTDPLSPYGLEFMGKEWDRLAVEGKQPSFGDADGSPMRRNTGTPSWGANGNPLCRNCGGDKYRAGPHKRNASAHRCQCERPDFPNHAAHQSRAMQAWHQAWATEALRVLKPGGFLLAAGGTRTFHRLVSAIEDAGFEIRDCIAHMYGSGFPKSLNVGNGRGTALKPAFEPWTLARKPLIGTVAQNVERFGTGALNIDGCRIGYENEADQKSAEWGAVRKYDDGGVWAQAGSEKGAPTRLTNVEGNPAGRWPANVALSHIESHPCPTCQGTGLKSTATGAGDSFPPELQCETCDGTAEVGGCERVGERRVKGTGPRDGGDLSNRITALEGGDRVRTDHEGHADSDGLETVEAWRCQEGCPILALDRQSGERRSSGLYTRSDVGSLDGPASIPISGGETQYADGGGSSRFFYVAKASRAERNAGLEGFEEAKPHDNAGHVHADERAWDIPGSHSTARANHHPTVKPVDLMRWLVRLVTPPKVYCQTCRGSGLKDCATGAGDSFLSHVQCEDCGGAGEHPGRVLDCFAGSGTTGIACVLEDFDFIGIEREHDYAEIARARIDYWARQPKQLGLLDVA